MSEYNELTKRLLAEGYTAEKHPAYVRVAGGQFGDGNALNNLYGGFEYLRMYADDRTYETPCGLLCKGRMAMDLCFNGKTYSHENDNPVIHCPMRSNECSLRKTMNTHGIDGALCPVKPTSKPYDQIHSAEAENAKFEAWRSQKRDEYIAQHPRHCPNHLRWDDKAKEWAFNYSPLNCRAFNCIGKRCPVLGKTIRPDKGNIYFDIEAEYPDKSKEGTFFEGERITEKTIGIQYFDKPELLDICEACIKAEKDHILWIIETNKVAKMYGSWMLFQARLGKIDFRYKVLNMRAEKRIVRDLEQDLQDAEDGTIIRDAAEEERKEKEAKKERRDKAKERRAQQARKLIITKGLQEMDEFERKRAFKILTQAEVLSAQHEHDDAQRRKEHEPVQLSFFDMIPGTEKG